MIVVKYAKRFPLSMVSHVDMLNVVKRIFTRAGVSVEYSAGFNPHMVLFFSPALSLGVESQCEYVCAAAAYAEDLKDRLNSKAPQGFECLEVYNVDTDPNLSAKAYAARYLFKAEGIGKVDLQGIVGKKDYSVIFKDKNGEVSKNVGDKIYQISVLDENSVQAVLACGNNNLRADRLLKQICTDFGCDWENAEILKTELLLESFRPADDYLSKLHNK